MNTTLTLMDLAGAIALLIWGVHMVQTGITRAFGPQLRRLLGYALSNRFKAFLAGLGVYGDTSEQHRNRVDDDGVCGGRSCRPHAGPGGHARSECRYYADRPGIFVRRVS